MSAISAGKNDSEKPNISMKFNLLVEALHTHKDKGLAQLLISWIDFKFDKYLKLEFQNQFTDVINLDSYLLGMYFIYLL